MSQPIAIDFFGNGLKISKLSLNVWLDISSCLNSKNFDLIFFQI